MPSTYTPLIAALADTQKAHFYLLLAQRLTIVQRTVWADNQLDASEQVARLKWLNEILHRVLNRLYSLQQMTFVGNEEDLWVIITEHVLQNRSNAGEVAWAIREAYTITTQHDLPIWPN